MTTPALLTCPEPVCHRAWFAGSPDALDHLLSHLHRSHAHTEASAAELVAQQEDQ